MRATASLDSSIISIGGCWITLIETDLITKPIEERSYDEIIRSWLSKIQDWGWWGVWASECAFKGTAEWDWRHSSEENQHQYTLTSERTWFGICLMICGNIDGANSFLTGRNDGARTFLNGWNCYLQAPDDGAGTFSLEKNWLGRDFFLRKNWLGSDFFLKIIDWAATFSAENPPIGQVLFSAKKNWWGTDFFWPGKTFFAPVISQ